jgi:hypothetical protein
LPLQGLKASTVSIRRGKGGEQAALCGTLSGLNSVSACIAAQHTNAGACIIFCHNLMH